MIEPYITLLWIGSLSFIFIFCTIIDMVTSSKEEKIVVTKKQHVEHSYIPSYDDKYEDVNLYTEEDNLIIKED